MHEEPTWTKACTCGAPISRRHCQCDITCNRCGTEDNTSGQRLCPEWSANPSTLNDDISNHEGLELAHANDH